MASSAMPAHRSDTEGQADTIRQIRLLLGVFIMGLVLSGVTAFPLQAELNLLERWLRSAGAPHTAPGLYQWIELVRTGLTDTYDRYPFLAYGTDWLAFAHLVIALAFWGPYRDPSRNRWVIDWGIISCGLVLPLALICGPLRSIPLYWRLIDCSFGVFGVIPLWMVRRLIHRLE